MNPASTLFNNTIFDLDLIDVRTSNGLFTWNNKQSRDTGIACRLDIFLLSESVMMVGGTLRVVVLPAVGSDHWPISLKRDKIGEHLRRTFIFEKLWLTHLDFHPLMQQWWSDFQSPAGALTYKFQQKLKYIKEQAKIWNKEHFRNIHIVKQ